MSLQNKEIEIIKETWSPVEKDRKNGGVLLFKIFFTSHPEYIPLFTDFKDLNLEDLANHRKLVSHALRVIDAISGIVSLLGDESKSPMIADQLTKLAQSHLKRQIDVEKFRNLGVVVIEFLKKINLNYLDMDSMVNSWSKLYSVIVNIVEKEATSQ